MSFWEERVDVWKMVLMDKWRTTGVIIIRTPLKSRIINARGNFGQKKSTIINAGKFLDRKK